ncbi:SDR family oxidoreductase [Acerihabitans sp. TG2]|uniref:SDR family oxidoreductase n=1 Tax=Acerihabitans sp. TG2 TaxID=3096008 RepID=UPI002B229F36|nr:SDR family oxidoreductase [Acerihabitans sp. TG2]MEA9389790.1 SDR family oxidoreductase [Acerihabitans sp. TG2]
MQITDNTILVTGGSSGIGQALAEALHRLNNQVIIAGRRQSALDKVTAANPGMQSTLLDMEDAATFPAFAATMAARFPTLNVLVNNAGIQQPENLLSPLENWAAMEAMVTTNLLGPMRLTSVMLPLLLRHKLSTVINVTSSLAFVPGVGVPTYCATKAAMHSYTQSLRRQLGQTSVSVIEIIPPYVQTNLGPGHGTDPRAMPLADFITETMAILRDNPEATEVVVERSKPLRFAAEQGRYDAMFKGLNEAMWSA